MEGNLLILKFLFVLTFSGVYGVNIRLYKQRNFTELFLQSNSTADCNNIPYNERDRAYSIRTDTCFIAYHSSDCTGGLSWSVKYLAGDIHLSDNALGRNALIASFCVCNDEEGGNQLNLDFTEVNWHDSGFSFNVMESYKNVCSCVNIPKHVHQKDRIINNHHNALMAFYEPDCSEVKWNPVFVPAGHSNSIYFRSKFDWERTEYKVQSFGPDTNSSYYLASCKFSTLPFETANTKMVATKSTENILNDGVGIADNLKGVSNQVEKLHVIFDAGMTNIVAQNRDEFNKLKNKVQELEDEFGNLSNQTDIHESFAKILFNLF